MLSEHPKVGDLPGEVKSPAPPVRRQSKGLNEPGPGDIVDGRYRLLEPLGQGGMGVVWKARSTALDVDVAVKLVRGAVASQESFKRMAREAHAAARLGHPAVARVLDFGSTQDAKPFVVMELLRGESLADRLDRQSKLEIVEAISLLLPLIEGLAEAHHQGIVHRDIKPENLFLAKTSRGRIQPKVLDFGIAKLDQQSDSATKLTQDGAVLGSPGYFSPEQACGRLDIDHRTDIWSISVVLYELITGELPFNGPNYNALLMSILQDEPRSFVAQGHGDDALWDIVRKGLARKRPDRFQSMACLGQALAQWLVDRGVRSDITARSLRDVWLNRGDSVASAAGSAAAFSPAIAERSKLATLVNRHEADTLAGGTLSLARGVPKRSVLPAKALAGLAAGALAALSWLATSDNQSIAPIATPASSAVSDAERASPSEVEPPPAAPKAPTVSTVSPTAEVPPAAAEPTVAVPKAVTAKEKASPASSPQRRSPPANSPPKITKAQPNPQGESKPQRPTEARPNRTRAEQSRVAPPSRKPVVPSPPATAPTPRRKVDAEFGF